MNNTPWQRFLLWIHEEHPNMAEGAVSNLKMLNFLLIKNKQIKKPISEITEVEEMERLLYVLKSPKAAGLQSRKFAKRASRDLDIYLEFLKTEREKDECAEKINKEEVAVIPAVVEREVDFSLDISYVHTKPISCKYKGKSISCRGWNNLFISLTKEFYHESSNTFPTEYKLSSGARIDIGAKNGMINPKEISDGLYLECNVSATGIIKKLRVLMSVCGIDSSDVEIKYRRNDTSGYPRNNSQKDSPRDCEYSNEVSKLIADHFKYGFRLGAPIELMRLRNYAEQDGVILPEADDVLEREIASLGMLIDGKIFVIQRKTLEEVASLIDGIFKSGVRTVFFEPLMEKNAEWLEERYIANVDMLKGLLKSVHPQYYYGTNFVTINQKMTEHEATVSEIFRVSDDQRVVFIRELEEELEYIPSEKIIWSMAASPDFVRISEGKYFIMKYFMISKEDAYKIYEYVSKTCDLNGYASITNVPLGNISEDNYELSPVAMQVAVFNTVLKKDFHLNGKIITREADRVNIDKILRDYIITKESCTVSEITEISVDLTGSQNRHKSLRALYDHMIRVDKEHFVIGQQIYFNTEVVDELLSDIVRDKYAPIKGVTTFALFPPCGTNWNHYLLESFCYRFSNKYRLEVMLFNDKNVGVIVAKESQLSYTDILCDAAANADIDLTPKVVGSFFFDNGFTAKRKYAKLPEIIKKAKTMREEV